MALQGLEGFEVFQLFWVAAQLFISPLGRPKLLPTWKNPEQASLFIKVGHWLQLPIELSHMQLRMDGNPVLISWFPQLTRRARNLQASKLQPGVLFHKQALWLIHKPQQKCSRSHQYAAAR